MTLILLILMTLMPVHVKDIQQRPELKQATYQATDWKVALVAVRYRIEMERFGVVVYGEREDWKWFYEID